MKGRTLRRDPRVALGIDDETPPFAFVLIEGTATISADHGATARAQARGRPSRNARMTTEPETPRCVVCGNDVTVEDDKIVFGPLVAGWSDDPPEAPPVEYVLHSHKACRAGRVSQSTR